MMRLENPPLGKRGKKERRRRRHRRFEGSPEIPTAAPGARMRLANPPLGKRGKKERRRRHGRSALSSSSSTGPNRTKLFF